MKGSLKLSQQPGLEPLLNPFFLREWKGNITNNSK